LTTGYANQDISINPTGNLNIGANINMNTKNITSLGTINSLSLPSSNIVGLTDTQTLTNKTINASQLVDGSISSSKYADFSISLGKLQSIPTLRFLGNSSNLDARVPEAMDITTVKNLLGLTGTNSGDQTITLSGDVTGQGTAGITATISNNAITAVKIATGALTLAKMEPIPVMTFMGNSSNLSSLFPEAMSVSTVKTLLGITNVNNVSINSWAGSNIITTVGAVSSGSLASGFGTINCGAITSDSITAKTTNGTLLLNGNGTGNLVTNSASFGITSTRTNVDSTITIDGPTVTSSRYIACYQNGTYKLAFGLQASNNFFVYDPVNNRTMFQLDIGAANPVRFPTYTTSGILRIDSGVVSVETNFTTGTNTINVDTVIAKTTNSNLYIHPNGTGNVVTNAPVIYIASNRTNTDSVVGIDGPTISNGRYIACYQNGGYKLSFGLSASSHFFVYDPVNNKDLFIALIGGGIRFPTYTTNGTLSVINGIGTVSSSSDRRLKQNEEALNPEASLQKIMNLQPKKYSWKSYPDRVNIGFIAQDVEIEIPEAVDGKKYEYEFIRDGASQGVEGTIRLDEAGDPVLDYDKPRHRGLDQCAILSTLVSAFQKSIEKINALEARINELDH